MRDTRPEAETVRTAVLRRISSRASLEAAFELSETIRQLALDRLRADYPHLTERQLIVRLIETRYAIKLPERSE